MAFRHVLLAAAIAVIVAATVSAQTTTPATPPGQSPAAGTSTMHQHQRHAGARGA